MTYNCRYTTEIIYDATYNVCILRAITYAY